MLIISLFLIAGVAAGICWPMIQRARAKNSAVAMEAVAVPATGPADIITSQRATEQLCPHCSMMNSGSRTVCIECGNQLSAKSFSALLDTVEKQEMIREGAQLGLLFLGMVIAMSLSEWLPMAGKVAILMITFTALAFRGWKQLSGD